MTQQDLAESSGLTQHWISHFECGRRLPSVDVLVRLSDALDVSVDCLLGMRSVKRRKFN